MVLDMYAQLRCILDRVVAPVTRVVCRTAIQIPRRADKRGNAYEVDTDDAAYALMEMEGGILATATISWATQLRLDYILQLKIDGMHGLAVAGLHGCRTWALVNTPKPPRTHRSFRHCWRALRRYNARNLHTIVIPKAFGSMSRHCVLAQDPQ